ncbi:YtxH-like protein [Hymenobacter daecheongensis DSM 21074]|uniref:YtxH-like protein n=1 Tax=Hymenobacter daecheongensis DSM 21074 TaxID=1121955 RepID=A0A1M6GA24_9BACT|nr:YtxH domain-containing protein [Hymenobacter daecheongensis]SHJ06810.1 YtxH-like protein [Hymenobacter daecheongensis DSM 21074]
MKDDNGKVILSLLAGATAGIVAGLLLAPETGDQTRAGLKKSASKWGDDLSKLLKANLGKLNDLTGATTSSTDQQQSRSAADDLLTSMTSQDRPNPATSPDRDDNDSDYDGMAGDTRHTGAKGYGRSL